MFTRFARTVYYGVNGKFNKSFPILTTYNNKYLSTYNNEDKINNLERKINELTQRVMYLEMYQEDMKDDITEIDNKLYNFDMYVNKTIKKSNNNNNNSNIKENNIKNNKLNTELMEIINNNSLKVYELDKYKN